MEHASLVAQRVKRLPAMWETQVQFLAQEDPLEKEMATHSSILAWGARHLRYILSLSPYNNFLLQISQLSLKR